MKRRAVQSPIHPTQPGVDRLASRPEPQKINKEKTKEIQKQNAEDIYKKMQAELL